MQAKIVLNPSYKGPIVIEEYLRKMKSQSSLGRMLSTYNKRLFILDFKHMKFYYLPEKGAQLSTATDVSLEGITRIYVDNQLQMLDDGQMWKHGFVILSGKRSYRLISHSRNNLENMLYALAHLINTETGKPLFDWNEYRAIQEQDTTRLDPIRPQVLSPTLQDQEKVKGLPTPPRRRSDEEKTETVQKEEPRVIRAQEDPEKYRELQASDKGRQANQESPERPERPTRQKKHEREQKELDLEENERESEARVVKNRDVEVEKARKPSNDVNKDYERNAQDRTIQKLKSEVDSVAMCESRVVMDNESVHAADPERERELRRGNYEVPEVREQTTARKVGSIRAKVEVLTIDPSEETSSINRYAGPYSTKNTGGRDNERGQEVNHTNVWDAKLVSPQNRRPLARPLKSGEQGSGFGRGSLGDSELVRKKENDNWDTPERPVNRNLMQQNEQEQNDGWSKEKETIKSAKPVEEDSGWSKEVTQPKRAEVYSAKKVADDEDDWDREMDSPPKKKTGVKPEVRSKGWGDDDVPVVPAKKGNVYQANDDDWDRGNDSSAKKKPIPTNVQSNTVVKKVNDDDDWDNDLFDNDTKSKQAGLRAAYKPTIQTSTYSAAPVSFGKTPKTVENNSYKQPEPQPVRGNAHNDWDDDL